METPAPPPRPSAADGSCLIYMWESCDGAPSPPPFVPLLPPVSFPASSRQRHGNRKDNNFSGAENWLGK